MKRLEELVQEALEEARNPKPWWHHVLVLLIVLAWLTGAAGAYRAYRFYTAAPKTPAGEAVYRVNNHGDVRYLTPAQYYGSFGLMIGAFVVAISCGMTMIFLERKSQKRDQRAGGCPPAPSLKNRSGMPASSRMPSAPK